MLNEILVSSGVFLSAKTQFAGGFFFVSITDVLIRLQCFLCIYRHKKNSYISKKRFVSSVVLFYVRLATVLIYSNASPSLLQRKSVNGQFLVNSQPCIVVVVSRQIETHVLCNLRNVPDRRNYNIPWVIFISTTRKQHQQQQDTIPGETNVRRLGHSPKKFHTDSTNLPRLLFRNIPRFTLSLNLTKVGLTICQIAVRSANHSNKKIKDHDNYFTYPFFSSMHCATDLHSFCVKTILQVNAYKKLQQFLEKYVNKENIKDRHDDFTYPLFVGHIVLLSGYASYWRTTITAEDIVIIQT